MDLINRQDAIDVIDKIFPADPMKNEYTQGITCGAALAEEYIKQLPSAEPELKRGTWQRRKGSDCWECSQCHAVLENDDLRMHNFYFCYHCGANMMNKMGYMDIEEVHYE